MFRKKRTDGPMVIDLTGPQGNAYCLLGYAKSFGQELGYTKEQMDKISEDMRSSDYEHLLEVFDREFGNLVILER